MGNANGREEEEEEEGGANHSPTRGQREAAGGTRSVNSNKKGIDNSEEVMVASYEAPHSPRATHSPLMFAPQVPVVPLHRPDEIQIHSHSWMQSATGYEDVSNEKGIPTMITWSHGGNSVAVEGSWDNWKTRVPLQRCGKDYTIMKVLASGVYLYRFVVDGQLRHAHDLPLAQDDAANTCNVLDLKDYVPDSLESISSFEPPPSPDSSYSNMQLANEDFAKEPPLLPPHLQMTLLNMPSSYTETPPPLPRPQHVVLNHLYMQKGKSGPAVVALGSTHRFHAKYVTVVLYKSLPR